MKNFERAMEWFAVLKALGCTLLQVASSDDPETKENKDLIVGDLQILSDMAALEEPPVRIAYEVWAWGINVNTWEDAWNVCKRVKRDNFGLCLDTFHICAQDFVSPHSPPSLSENSRENLLLSLAKLSARIPPEKVFYLEISDGSNLVSPEELIIEAKNEDTPPLKAWSNSWRPLPFMDTEYGGCLPVMDAIRAVLATGYKGPWSYEVSFAREMMKEDSQVLEKWTKAAAASHARILKELGKGSEKGEVVVPN